MPKKSDEKLTLKKQALIHRTALALRVNHEEATTLLQIERRQSIRLNPLKGDQSTTLSEIHALGWSGKAYSWLPEGFTNESSTELIRDSTAVSEGRVFIQNAASWLPVVALDPQPHESILDVCAAPGGKTSHIAAITNNQAHITANDNSRPRLSKMRANLARLGVTSAKTTLFDATQLARKLDSQQFDKILLDAPCSGEGMMRLDHDKDFATWSVAHIKRLQQLQKRIISQAWQLLKPGGILVYSTCTMAPEENEAVVSYLLRAHQDTRIEPLHLDLPNRIQPVTEWNNRPFDPRVEHCVRLKPSRDIEAFFVCKFKKLATINNFD